MLTMEILQQFCGIVREPHSAITTIQKTDEGLNNVSYCVSIAERVWLIRIPGAGTEQFCNRIAEAQAYQQLQKCTFAEEPIFLDSQSGVKITPYDPLAHTASYNQPSEWEIALNLLRQLHRAPIHFAQSDTHFDRIQQYCRIARSAGAELSKSYSLLIEKFQSMQHHFIDKREQKPTHGDFLPNNILIRETSSPLLIDWEFARMADPFDDLGTFCHHANLTGSQQQMLLTLYLEREASAFERQKIIFHAGTAALMWIPWALWKERVSSEKQCYTEFASNAMDYAATEWNQLSG